MKCLKKNSTLESCSLLFRLQLTKTPFQTQAMLPPCRSPTTVRGLRRLQEDLKGIHSPSSNNLTVLESLSASSWSCFSNSFDFLSSALAPAPIPSASANSRSSRMEILTVLCEQLQRTGYNTNRVERWFPGGRGLGGRCLSLLGFDGLFRLDVQMGPSQGSHQFSGSVQQWSIC